MSKRYCSRCCTPSGCLYPTCIKLGIPVLSSFSEINWSKALPVKKSRQKSLNFFMQPFDGTRSNAYPEWCTEVTGPPIKRFNSELRYPDTMRMAGEPIFLLLQQVFHDSRSGSSIFSTDSTICAIISGAGVLSFQVMFLAPLQVIIKEVYSY